MALTDKLTAIADAIRVQSGKTDKLSLAQMPDEIMGLQSLSFEVVHGTSAPNSPKENTLWVNTNTAISSWDFSATEPCRRSKNKNRLTYPFYHTTMTNNGITFTDNKDGTVTANGTATAQARFRPFHSTVESGLIWLEPGTYVVSGCPSGGSASTWLWEAFDADNNVTLAKDYGKGANFTITAGTHVRGSLIIQSGVAVSNQVWKPQIEKGSTATSFVKGDATGQVWFSTSATSPVAFNALKKNNITVYPLSAKQYVSGAWVSKTAKSYQGGAWKSWLLYLYQTGNTFNDVTGGYYTNKVNTSNGTGSVTLESGKIALVCDGAATALVRTQNKVNLSGISTLHLKICINVVSGYDNHGYLHFYAVENAITATGQTTGGGATSEIDYKPGTNTETTVSLDVSGITNGKYIVVALHTSQKVVDASCDILEIWGE